MNTEINKWLESFNNSDSGYSRKKLTAFLIAWSCYVAPNIVWLKYAAANKDFSLMVGVLTVNAALITSLLGIAALQQNANKKIDANNQPPTP